MITKLHIENYVLIDRLDLAFEPGLNIITGETGAGKSILLGALGLLLGARADTSVARDPARNCVLEAGFRLDRYGLAPLFETLDLDYDDETVIRRVITPAGKSRLYVNDLPVQQAALRTLAPRLVDIHSQHQTLLLGSGDFQLEVIDSVADTQPLAETYAAAYARWREAAALLERLREEAAKAGEEEDFIRYQHDQLAAAQLRDGEQEELEEEEKRLAHAEEIREALLYANGLLDEQEPDILSGLRSIRSALDRAAAHSSAVGELSARVENALYELRDINGELLALAERSDSDPGRLEEVRARLDTLYSLQQKHRLSSVAELLALQEEYRARLDIADRSGERITAQEKIAAEALGEAQRIAAELTERRSAVLSAIEEQVIARLRELGMENAVLRAALHPAGRLTPSGADAAEFLFSANRGGRLEKIDKVASGGEMSRLMLALKVLVARHRRLPAIVFDEIDTGVSGRVADSMGEIMQQLGESLQVINITHLPQVAAKGKHHFFVYKSDDGGTVSSAIRKLSPEERVSHIAAMLSGSTVTAAALAQAGELLKKR